MEEFNGFEDLISSFPICRGRAKSREEEEDTVVGEFKVTFFRMSFQGLTVLT